jgi:hypothetical protein
MQSICYYISTFWPMLIPYVVFCIVMGPIIEKVHEAWLRWRLGKARKKTLALIKEIRTRNNAERAQRKQLKVAEETVQSLKNRLAQIRLERNAAPCDSFDTP